MNRLLILNGALWGDRRIWRSVRREPQRTGSTCLHVLCPARGVGLEVWGFYRVLNIDSLGLAVLCSWSCTCSLPVFCLKAPAAAVSLETSIATAAAGPGRGD